MKTWCERRVYKHERFITYQFWFNHAIMTIRERTDDSVPKYEITFLGKFSIGDTIDEAMSGIRILTEKDRIERKEAWEELRGVFVHFSEKYPDIFSEILADYITGADRDYSIVYEYLSSVSDNGFRLDDDDYKMLDIMKHNYFLEWWKHEV